MTLGGKGLKNRGRNLGWLMGLSAGVGIILAATGPNREDVLTRVVLRSLEAGHFDSPKLDDAFAAKVFEVYLKRLDPQKRFLLASDVALLREQEMDIDDQLRKGHYDISETADKLLKKRIGVVRTLVSQILKQPMDLDETDSLAAQNEKLPWCKTEEELRERWLHLLKYQVLTRLDYTQEKNAQAEKNRTDSLQKGASSGKDGDDKKTVKTKAGGLPGRPAAADEKSARDYVARSVQRVFKRMDKTEKSDRISSYLNAVANVYDPHTEYFKPEVKEEFDLNMTGRLEGIGAVLKEEDGYIKVVSIVPGSASWRQKELKAEDKIIKVAQGDGEPVDLIDASVNEAVKLIRGKKGTEVRLTVENPAGQIKVIRIVRDIVVVEETYAKSAVLGQGKDKSRIGYIDLPAFYHDFNDPKGRSSSSDLAKELKLLKARRIDGIILDLRNNGGGALDDAVKMAGLFFKKGPVVMVRDGRDKINVLSDSDPSVEWDGPLLVMINGFSASASEIVAAALQDYNRAVIFGTDTSFGKGTVQTLVDLDAYLPPSYDDIKPLGTLKVTIQKFYRVNGGSTQFRGVVPDILIPDAYTKLEVGESSLEYPLPYDSVKALKVERGPITENLLGALNAKEEKRLGQDPKAKHFLAMQEELESLRKRETVPLRRADFFAEQEKTRRYSDEQDSLLKNISDFQVDPVGEADHGQNDSLTLDKVNRWREQIHSDFYLREAVSVMDDLILSKP